MTRKASTHQHGLVGNKRPVSKMRKRRNKLNLKANTQKRIDNRNQAMTKALKSLTSEF